MRGNPLCGGAGEPLLRSIPAYAGEPARCSGVALLRLARVYPRVCGGTAATAPAHLTKAGLSPRMRGNPPVVSQLSDAGRSIPAYAGEPASDPCGRGDAGVYPRVCGGTTYSTGGCTTPPGLSPRMRGNRGLSWSGLRRTRSIPAYAGEPRRIRIRPAVRKVYPRVCGGTKNRGVLHHTISGLSPRMRGNQRAAKVIEWMTRSIPAYAGEPCRAACRAGIGQVYPRVCGGTPLLIKGGVVADGLSPRMRGNL